MGILHSIIKLNYALKVPEKDFIQYLHTVTAGLIYFWIKLKSSLGWDTVPA
jgi:hypothetical protein